MIVLDERKLGMIQCKYLKECEGAKSSNCKICEHNQKRNYKENYFVKANDKPIPTVCPVLSYEGTAEQTAGYKCPVCGCHTNPYHLDKENLCSYCGYRLNIR